MQSERPRARRYTFAASIEMTDVESEAQLIEPDLRPKSVRVWRDHAGTAAGGDTNPDQDSARGSELFGDGESGSCGARDENGVVFTKIEPHQQLVLEKWVAELREARGTKPVKV